MSYLIHFPEFWQDPIDWELVDVTAMHEVLRDDHDHDWTPMDLAIKYASVDTLRRLIEMGATLHKHPKQSSGERLFETDDPEKLEYLIEQGEDVNRYTAGSLATPLHHHVANQSLEAIRVLLRHGADVNVQNCWKETPLQLACKVGHQEIVAELVKYGSAV